MRGLAAGLLLAAAAPALAEKRLALVVGNDSYGGVSTTQAADDAVAVRNALQDVGFLVDHERNADAAQLRDAVRRFGARLAGPERDTVGVFYYVGAAAQTGGRSYLLGSGRRPAVESDLPRLGLDLAEAVELLQTGGGRRLVLVDGAVPVSWRGPAPELTPGLARIKAPPGFLIGYAQEPDRAPRLGPYAAALDAALRQPGLPLDGLLARVRRAVADRTAGEQLTWESVALDTDAPIGRPGPAPANLAGNPAREAAESARPFRDCPACPRIVTLPRGSFLMGSERGDDNERPVHSVTIDYPLAMSRFEITHGEWQACVDEGGCTYVPPRVGSAEHPVGRVSWEDAQVYAAWLTRRTGRRYRLPSEAEWEYAARAGTRTEFYWGDRPEPGRAHCYGCQGEDDEAPDGPLPVGSFKPNGFGLHDMAGNQSEWTLDCYLDDYEGAPGDGRAREQGRCDYRVFRGGSWYLGPERMRMAFRNGGLAGLRAARVGFRVVRSP